MTVTVVKSNPPVLPNNITWSTANIDEDRVNISEDGRSLHISDITSEDEGYYQVIIWHPAGQRNKTTYLKVAEGTCIIVYLLNAIIFIEGQFNVLSMSVGLSLGMILVISLIIFGLTFIIVKRKKKQIEVDSLEAYRQNQ